MPAPRLLDKRVVSSELADEKRRQIQSGINLAKKVDAVRETFQKEESDLESFRRETITRIQKEIDAKIIERDNLDKDITRRRGERIQLEAPIDLKEAWNEVQLGRLEVTEWKDRLGTQTVEQVAKEAEIAEIAESTIKRSETSKEKEKLAERTLNEAESKYEEASVVLDKAKADSARIIEDAKQKEKKVIERELSFEVRENEISDRENRNQTHEIDLSNREKALKVRYDTFIKAQNYIKSKK